MRLNRTLIAVTSLALASLAGCATQTVTMEYQPTTKLAKQAPVMAANSTVVIGSVIDSRDAEANWLGAVEGEFGYPVNKLYTDVDTADAVASVFRGALETRGILGSPESALFSIDVDLARFDSNQAANKQTQADIAISLQDRRTGQTVFKRHYRTRYETGQVAAQGSGTTLGLGEFANLALSESIDQALDDPDLLKVLQTGQVTRAKANTAADNLSASLAL